MQKNECLTNAAYNPNAQIKMA